MNVSDDLAGWLRLALTPGLGPATLRDLLGRFGLPEQILSRPRRDLAPHLTSTTLREMDSDSVDAAVTHALRWAAQDGNAVLTLADSGYPASLLETHDPPGIVFARGRIDLLARPALAMVGSRNATAQGARTAEQFAKAFSDAGLTIVSGLALGIDAAAHRGALKGRGSTIAVLGTGIDVVYPRQNAALAAQIAREGLLISEFGLGSPAATGNFPRRNRLISGLARGCVVVEAAPASGSLITARFALEQGREVFAIPGSIHSTLSRGCHALIKSGAKLVECADDVLSELNWRAESAAGPSPSSTGGTVEGDSGTELLAQMGFDPVSADLLSETCKLPVEVVAATLLRLELTGHVASLPGGRYQRLNTGDAT